MAESHYYHKVYAVTRAIPHGKVSTYGHIADYLALGSARMVGWALHQCIGYDENIPAHRVVNAKGELSGRLHFHPPELMQRLLENEGLTIIDHRISNFDHHLWKPAEHLPEADTFID